MAQGIEDVLRAESRIDFALVFGSHAKGTERPDSDLDVAISLSRPLKTRELLDLVSRLESASGRCVDLVVIEDAPAPLAYRVFRDGILVFERDHDSLVRRKARAILEYLDFQPIERILTRGALAAARNG